MEWYGAEQTGQRESAGRGGIEQSKVREERGYREGRQADC
jgi:hypothetical protein